MAADRFSEGSQVLREQRQQQNPAAPRGLQQQAGGRLQQWNDGDRFAQGQQTMAEIRGETDYTAGAQGWYTGANSAGTKSGWDNAFVENFVSGWDTALEQGTAADYFRNGGTGVVTWDHEAADGRTYRFGDVVKDGEVTGNVYDDFDKNTANLMMAPWVLDAKTQRKTFESDERLDLLDAEIKREQADRTENFEKSLGAMQFESDVKERTESFQEGAVDEGLAAGGAVGGAAVGATLGSVVPGLGTVAGGIAGAVAGGVGAWLNRDSLARQAATAYEITRMSDELYGAGAGLSTGITQWSGVAMKLISPLQNLNQGLYDDDRGNGESKFYRVDKTGEREAGGIRRTLDVVAAVGDGLLQFASPAGLAMYSASMAGTVAGQIAELTTTGGNTFDFRRGSFDNVFLDDDGNFDASAAAAGIGKIGIDAVQLGMARGLAGRTNAQLAQVGDEAAYKTIGSRLSGKLPTWAGGTRGLGDDVERVRAGGFSFTRDKATGKIVDGSGRATLSLLAPSEQLGALSARVLGMRNAAKANGAYTADDFYRAANELAMGERKITMGLVNGFGEAYEEGVQAVLEPHSHGDSATMEEIWEAAKYGFAGGLGMSLGFGVRGPDQDRKLFEAARMAHYFETGGEELTREAWGNMTPAQQRAKAAPRGLAKATLEAAYAKYAEDQAIEVNAGVAGAARLLDAVRSAVDSATARATDRTDGAFVMTQLEEVTRVDDDGNLLPGQMPADAVGASAIQTMVNLTQHGRGMVIQLQTLDQRLTEAMERTAADPEDVDAAELVPELQRQVEAVELAITWNQRLLEALEEPMGRILDETATVLTLEADVAEINDLLRRAFTEQVGDYRGAALTPADKRALARAVSLQYTRDPQDQSGSYPLLVPQVSVKLTLERTDNLLEISHAILPGLSGDYDGDKVRQLNQLILDDNEFVAARAGANMLGAGTAVNVGTPKYEKYNVEQLAEALSPDASLTLRGFASNTLARIGTAVRNRYDGVVGADVLDDVLEDFFAAVRANDKDARAKLLDGLAAAAGGQITDFGRTNLSNEWLWLDQLIVSTFQQFQESYAAHRPAIGDAPDTSVVEPLKQEAAVRERRTEKAATLMSTMAMLLSGDSPFRMFQKLHYTVLGAPVLGEQGLAPLTLVEQAQFYRELGQQVTQSELDRVMAADEISGRAYVQLKRLADDFVKIHPGANAAEALAVVANLQVQDLEVDADGTVTGGHVISLAQMLLKQELKRDRIAKARVWDSSPELQAKHRRLEQMTRTNSRDYPHGAEQAFVELVGAQQMFALLGDDAEIFGPHLTVEQFIRYYSSLSEIERRDLTRALQDQPSYLGAKRVRDMPYSLAEVEGPSGIEISPYRSLVDAVLAVGNSRITMDAKGNLHGDLASRSNRVAGDFHTAHRLVRESLFRFAGLDPRRDDELTVDVVRRMLEGNPDFARQVMDLIPANIAPAVLGFDGNTVKAANWVYKMFTLKDPAEAEMHMWRNLLLAEWKALGIRAHLDEADGDDRLHARTYDRLPRRMHQVLYELHPNLRGDGGLAMAQFFSKLEEATDLTEFLRWVNTTGSVRGNRAPLVAWVDDTAEFDPDKARGGWTKALAGAELREAISNLKTGAEMLSGEIAQEAEAFKADTRVLAAIERVIDADAGKPVTLDNGDRETYDAFVKWIELAAQRRSSLGPQAMIYQTAFAGMGFYASAHTKGKNPPNVAAAGLFEAQRDAFDYVTNYERMLGSLTTLNLDAVGSNLAEVAKDSGRTMDDHGRVVEWEAPTPAAMLALLKKPETRPLARAVLFPQVQERTASGQLSTQLLVGKSLRDLLNGSAIKQMYPHNGRLSQAAAQRYVSFVEGLARKHEGHLAVQRAVNDIVIARTNAADRELQMSDLEALSVNAYHEVAQVLQMAGAIAANPNGSGPEVLRELLADVRAVQRRRRTARAFGFSDDDTQEVTDLALDAFFNERKSEVLKQIQVISASDLSDVEKQAQIAAANEGLARFKKQMDLLRTDDMAGQVVDMFSITGDATEQAARKAKLVEYVGDHLQVLEQVSSLKLVLNKLTQQLLDRSRNGQVSLTDKEWEQLSRAVIGVYLDDVAHTTAPNVSVSPWPDADHARDQRYYDTSWTYLVEEMLDAGSPLVQAAVEAHRMAGLHNSPVPTKQELADLLDRTILDAKRLGPWTGDIPRGSIAANERLDSAAAAAAIAMAGNSPKRQAALIAATKRTYDVPGQDLLSTTRLSFLDLQRDLFDEVAVELPGVGAVQRPLAQLNNRYASSVVLHIGGEQVDLLAEDANLGRLGHPRADGTPYREIHLDRLAKAVEKAAARRKANPAGAIVEVSFLHPDSQPEGPEWANNLFFEGTNFKLDGDRHDSLLSGLWFSPGGINQATQRAALDASKLGVPALKVIDVPTAAERQALEADWSADFSAMLRAKTRLLISKDLGFGELDPEFYNAVYKDMKLRHFVRTADGLLTADQVIAAQQRGEVVEGELWVPSDDVLRSMVGEQGTQGVPRVFADQLEIDPAMIRRFRGVTPQMMERFREGLSGETTGLAGTRVAHRGRQSQLVVRAMLDEATLSAFDQRIEFWHSLQSEIYTDRAEAQRSEEFGFNAKRNLRRAKKRGAAMLDAENISLQWQGAGVAYIGPRNPEKTAMSKSLLRDLAAAKRNEDGTRTGWIYQENGAAKTASGILTQHSLEHSDRPAYRVAPGDLVVFEVDSFNGDMDLARKRLDYLTSRGAIILLGASDSQADGRAELAEYLLGGSYEPIIGSAHAFQPVEHGSRYQNLKARSSTMTETRGVSAKSRLAIFHTTGLGIQENAAWVNAGNERLGSVAVIANLVPTDFLAGFNVPVEQFTNESQIQKVRAHLRSLATPEGRALLKEQANKHLEGDERAAADDQFDRDFDRMLQRFDSHPGVVVPQPDDSFGTGDFIPLVDNVGRVLLYRHGYQAPTRAQFDRMAAQTLPGASDAQNVGVFPSKREPQATTHTGIVRDFRYRAGYGFSIEMDVPLSVFGDKKQLEWNGMKYVLAPKPDSVVLPEHGFFENMGVDMIASADDMLSKEAFTDLVDNHRNAFAFFGVDFLPDVAKFFFPKRWAKPAERAKAEADAMELLYFIARRTPRISVAMADELINSDRMVAEFRDQLPALQQAGLPGNWMDRLADLGPVENKITASILVYLMTPGARVEDVLRSGGFNDTSTAVDAQSRKMPRLFTQIFDNARLGSPLRAEMFRRFNAQLHNPNTDGTGYRLHEDWTFEILNSNPEKNLRGFLQFAEAHSAGDNPVKNGMSFDETGRQQVSVHSADIAFGSLGAQTAIKYDIAKARAFFEAAQLDERDVADGGVWRLLTDVPAGTDKSFAPWRAQTEGEAARRELGREAMVQYRQALDFDTDHGWDAKGEQQRKYEALRVEIVQKLGMLAGQSGLVDFWVRQLVGRPDGIDENGEHQGWITGADALQAAQDILWNVEMGFLPVTGAEVPLMHLHDLQAIYRANRSRTNPWRPKNGLDDESGRAENWNAWVEVALGSAFTSDNLFDPLYLLALDGFMHGYQNATRSLMDLPVSVDALVSQQLLDPDLNQMVVSINDAEARKALDPVLLDVVQASIEQLVGGKRIAGGAFAAKAAPAALVAKRRAERRRWRKEAGVPVPVDVTMKNFRKNGAQFIDTATTTNALARTLINLRVGTALINPALWVSMGPEQWIRGSLDRMANLVTGQGTTGLTAKAMASTGLSVYSSEDLRSLGNLYDVLGRRNDFKSLLYKDLHFRRPHADAMGRVEKIFEGYAKFGSRMQDATYGMKANTMARRYIEGALQHINATPTQNPITVQMLVDAMSTDPLWLKNNYPEAHQAGANALAQIRSLKDTTASRLLKGIYEPMAESSHGGVNMFGNVVLKLPLLFSTYAMNVATTITGLQGLDQMIAMGLEGRAKGPNHFLGRLQAKMKGEQFTVEQFGEFDMSSVLEGIDLSRAFIRGGLTHTGLFALGMMMGELGLGGEDEEARRRRLLAEHQGVGTLYDPRALQNDFRNADALFLDNIPFLGAYFKSTPGEDGRSMAEMHWMLKQFVSPIMGMEKFLQTGDFRQVTWGFEDAMGSMPLINTMMWGQAVDTAHELADLAAAEDELGGPGNLVKSAGFLTTAVGVYERMLFENAFVNQLYIGFDEWDRDPYVLPLRDSDGDLQRDITGQTRRNDLALSDFVDPETGKVVSGYLGRSGVDQQAHVFTENRATAALIASLFTGGIGDSDFWRYNMPIKTRKIEKGDVTQAEAEAYVKAAASYEMRGQLNVTVEEILPQIRDTLYSRGDKFYTDAEVRAVAEATVAKMGTARLSILDEAGREHLTTEGARAIFDGLKKGSVTLDSPALAGVYIPFEMRQKVMQDWSKELVQEGIDLGLDESKAISRMKRMMTGRDYTTGVDDLGLSDILWSDKISYSDTLVYGQLNTTYVVGPDGRPWATGFSRDKLMGALGLRPLRHTLMPSGNATTVDSRMNTVDLVNGNNTGLRALVPFDDSRNVPTDVEIGKAIEDAIEQAAQAEYTPFEKKDGDGGSGYSPWRNFGSGYRRYGGGGYGGGGGGGYFSKMYGVPDNVAPYGNSAPFINTSNPILRRAFIRRERVSSERGRLNQWQ